MIDRVSFENFKSLKSVSIDLGRLTVLVGPNGAGKSSVLQGIHLLSQTGLSRRNEKRRPWHRFSSIFSGPRHPGRIASPGRPTVINLAMRELDGDELRLGIVVPDEGDDRHDAERLTFHIMCRGPEGVLEASVPGPDDVKVARTLNAPRVRRFIAVVYLHLNSSLMTRPSVAEDEEPRFAADGEGLASTLAWLAGAQPDVLADLASELAKVVPGVHRILTYREKIVSREMEKIDIDGQPVWRPVDRPKLGDRFAIQFDNKVIVPADLLSEGTVLALGLLAKLREPRRPRLVLLDDIDRGLHIEAQAKLVSVLRSLMTIDPELQILCTTHSPYLLSLFEPSEVRVMALDANRFSHVKPLTAHPDFDKWKFGTQTGELWAALGDAWVVSSEAKP